MCVGGGGGGGEGGEESREREREREREYVHCQNSSSAYFATDNIIARRGGGGAGRKLFLDLGEYICVTHTSHVDGNYSTYL